MKKHPFLEYTGKIYKDNFLYYLIMEKKKKKIGNVEEYEICSSSYINICNPTIDNAFKNIFKNKSILICFLNDLFFPKKNKIKDIEFIKNEFPGPISKLYGYGSLRIDLGVKCTFFKEEEKNIPISAIIKKEEDDTYMDIELNTDNNEKIEDLIIDIEMQLDSKKEDKERFIRYLSYLDASYASKQIWVIVLNLTNNNPYHNKSSKIFYTEENLLTHREIKIYENRIVFEIDLNFFYKMMIKNKKIWILNENNYLGAKGKEWLKLITVPCWCKSYNKNFFAFPNLDQLEFTQKEVRNALSILSFASPLYHSSLVDAQYLRKEMEEINKIKKNDKKKIKLLRNIKKKLINTKRKMKY